MVFVAAGLLVVVAFHHVPSAARRKDQSRLVVSRRPPPVASLSLIKAPPVARTLPAASARPRNSGKHLARSKGKDACGDSRENFQEGDKRGSGNAHAKVDISSAGGVQCRLSAQCCQDWSKFYSELPERDKSANSVGSPPDSRQKSSESVKGCVRLLLIVIFNSPFLQNVKLINGLYGDVFTKIVFYSDVEDRHLGVHQVPLMNGFFQQFAVAKAMHQYPDFDGYLWIGDDVFFNYPTSFGTLNVSRVWAFPHERPARCFNAPAEMDPYFHWKQSYGKEESIRAFNCLAEEYRQRAMERFDCQRCMVKGGSDIGFVPQRFRRRFLDLAYIFRNVFFEIAFPTILPLIVDSPEADIDYFQNGLYLWGDPGTKPLRARRLWKPSVEFVHPVKLSNSGQRDDIQNWLNSAYQTFSKTLQVCKKVKS